MKQGSKSIIGMSDVLGGVAFSPVKNDMLGNIKVRRSPRPILSSALIPCMNEANTNASLTSNTESPRPPARCPCGIRDSPGAR